MIKLKQQGGAHSSANQAANESPPPNVFETQLIFDDIYNTTVPNCDGTRHGPSPLSEACSPSKAIVFFAVQPGKQKRTPKSKKNPLGMKGSGKIRKTDPERPKKHVNKFIIYRSAVCRAFQGGQLDISRVIATWWHNESKEMKKHCAEIASMERGTSLFGCI
jgi:hypothetical protein